MNGRGASASSWLCRPAVSRTCSWAGVSWAASATRAGRAGRKRDVAAQVGQHVRRVGLLRWRATGGASCAGPPARRGHLSGTAVARLALCGWSRLAPAATPVQGVDARLRGAVVSYGPGRRTAMLVIETMAK
jgi:hypothetical protein